MRETVLDLIEFAKEHWSIQTAEGTSWGGSVVLCTLKDMAKLAYICLNQGRWNNEQLISEEYIRAATSKQIDNSIMHREGYGYQIWREKDNGFSFEGMGSQLALCFPDEEFIFACTADTQMMKHTGTLLIKNIFREEIYKKLHDQPILNDDESHEKLDRKSTRLNSSHVAISYA